MSTVEEKISVIEDVGCIIFHPIAGLKEIHFSVKGSQNADGIVTQVGLCTGNAVPPKVYTTGEERITYTNIISEGTYTFHVGGSIAHFYIAGNNNIIINNIFCVLY